MPPISRREFVKLAAGTVCGANLFGCSPSSNSQSDANQLNIFSWADYLAPDTIINFEKRFGIKVVYDTFASNEALLARMQAGSVDYDIVVPTNYSVTKLLRLKLLQQIDKSQIPNVKNLMARFTDFNYDPGLHYCVPYTFGTTGLAYNKVAFKKRGLIPPDNWDAFWDVGVKQRMTLLEDARETIGLALKRRGWSYNSVDTKQIELARKDLQTQKPLTMCYTSDQVIVYLASGDSLLSLAFSGDAHQAMRENPDVDYIIPADGASMWLDNMCVPVGAPHRENAYKWINYILEPEVSAAISNATYYPMPNQAALKYVDPKLVADKSLFPTEELMSRCEAINDIGDGIYLYDRAWTELKCI